MTTSVFQFMNSSPYAIHPHIWYKDNHPQPVNRSFFGLLQGSIHYLRTPPEKGFQLCRDGMIGCETPDQHYLVREIPGCSFTRIQHGRYMEPGTPILVEGDGNLYAIRHVGTWLDFLKALYIALIPQELHLLLDAEACNVGSEPPKDNWRWHYWSVGRQWKNESWAKFDGSSLMELPSMDVMISIGKTGHWFYHPFVYTPFGRVNTTRDDAPLCCFPGVNGGRVFCGRVTNFVRRESERLAKKDNVSLPVAITKIEDCVYVREVPFPDNSIAPGLVFRHGKAFRIGEKGVNGENWDLRSLCDVTVSPHVVERAFDGWQDYLFSRDEG